MSHDRALERTDDDIGDFFSFDIEQTGALAGATDSSCPTRPGSTATQQSPER